MPDSLLAALAPLFARAAAFLEKNPELRGEVATAARAIAVWAEAAKPAAAAEAGAVSVPVTLVTPPAENPIAPRESALDPLVLPVPIPSRMSVVLPPVLTPAPVGDHGREFVPLPLATVASRCRLKASAAKVMARKAAGATDTAAEEEALRAQAEQIPDCGLWMLDPHGYPKSKAVWDDLAGGFQVAAAAADLLRAWAGNGLEAAVGQEVLTHAAEAQSMLLYAVADVGWVSRDHEQVQMFVHIRELGKQHQIYVPRFLRREDPADPSNWPNLAERLKVLTAKFKPVAGTPVANGVSAVDQAKVRKKALDNLRFKLRKLADDPAAAGDEWPRVVELLDQAVTAGVPSNSSELRELLLPVYDKVPDDLPTTAGVERVLRAIELYRDSQAVVDQAEEESGPSVEVLRAKELLSGKELILIGGQRRPHHVSALRQELGLTDVRWLSTPEQTPFTVFEPDIARPDVAVVVLAIRWSNHDYVDVQKYCDKYSKPMVRLRTGYNPKQVAHSIVTQAGERLAALASAAASDGFSAGL